MLNMLNEKVDYSRDPEAPISLGMKILKKLEKEGWKGADVYDAVEEIIVSADVKYPKQMAMRLKRTLENYDMWEAPYKGLVTKIQKWQFVNENLAAAAAPIAKAAGRYAAMKFAGRAADSLGDKFDNMLNGSTNESESNISYYDEVYGIIDQLVYKYKEWSLKDIQDQLDNGDIWFEDVMRKMDIDMNDLSDDEDAELCNIIINAMHDYLVDKDYFNQLHESVSNDYDKAYAAIDRLVYKYKEWTIDNLRWQLETDNISFRVIIEEMGLSYDDIFNIYAMTEYRDLFNVIENAMQNYIDDKDYFGQLHESVSDDFYYRPMDIKQLMNKNKERGAQLSRFEHWVLDAALWARARMKNYHGYSDKIPAVEYKNGKFYAQTQDGMVEVPYNYNDMTPEWLFRK